MSARCTWWPHEGGFADRGQFPAEGLQTELQTGPAGFAVQQPGQGQGHHAVQSMNADLLISPVIQGLPADEVGILHGAEGGLHMMLTVVSQNDHRPELAEWSHYIGSEQVRNFRFEGDRLILSLEETPPNGERRRYQITWQRVSSTSYAAQGR